MSDWLYTPTDDEIRTSATEFDSRHTPPTFDRWLAAALADAIRTEAERVNDRTAGSDARAWLLARADAISTRRRGEAESAADTPPTDPADESQEASR